jgi:hypothetical protein
MRLGAILTMMENATRIRILADCNIIQLRRARESLKQPAHPAIGFVVIAQRAHRRLNGAFNWPSLAPVL